MLKTNLETVKDSRSRLVSILNEDLSDSNLDSYVERTETELNSISSALNELYDSTSIFSLESMASNMEDSVDNLNWPDADSGIDTVRAEATGLSSFFEGRFKTDLEALDSIITNLFTTQKEIALYQNDLRSYRRALLERERKAKDQQSLAENLIWLIFVIGALSIGVILVIRIFPDNAIEIWVDSGQVIQFVTVMILLSVILALGLVGVIQEETLGTLLGGIAGYVLAQGVGRAAASQALKERDRIVKSQNPNSEPDQKQNQNSSNTVDEQRIEDEGDIDPIETDDPESIDPDKESETSI